jgi:hypothetical protein
MKKIIESIMLFWYAFKPRSIHQLLKAMRENQDLFEHGLCLWALNLEPVKITSKEYYILRNYISANHIFKYNKPGYWWPANVIYYRLQWIDYHLILTGSTPIRSISEILHILSKSDYLSYGLCVAAPRLYLEDKISKKEHWLLRKYISMHIPENCHSVYWWPKGEVQPRLDWINSHIILNNERS